MRAGIVRTGRFTRAIFTALAIMAFAPVAAWAQCTVANPNDSGSGSLRAAIASCTSTITFASGVTGTITLTSGPLVFNNAGATTVTVQGPGAANLKISGGGTSEVLDITAGQMVTISGVTIENGAATEPPLVTDPWTATGSNGGGIWNDGTLILQDSVVTGNSALTGAGGGIYNSSIGILTLDHCTISDNTSGQDVGSRGYGGGLLNAGTATITSSSFLGNIAAGGGQGAAIYNVGSAVLTNSTVTGNQSTDSQGAGGGAGAVYSDGQMQVANNTIFGNTVAGSGGSGGGLLQSVASSASPAYGNTGVISGPVSPVITNPMTVYTPNETNFSGAGTIFTDPCLTPVYTIGANSTLMNIVSPPAVPGSCQLGVASWSPVVDFALPGCARSSNPCAFLAPVSALNSTNPYYYQIYQANVPENQVSFIYLNFTAPFADGDTIDPYIMGCNIPRNGLYSPNSGQARTLFPNGTIEDLTSFEEEFSPASINCTVWNNGPLAALASNVQVGGKGYYLEYTPGQNKSGTNFARVQILLIDTSTPSGCVEGSTPSACTLWAALLNINVVPGPGSTVANTIVAGNAATNDPDAAGVFTDLGGNLIGTAGSDAGNAGFNVSTLLGSLGTPEDPMLLPLGNYGGLTETLLPSLGSPVIGAGNITYAAGSYDQRDFPRTLNGFVDIGADEFQGAALSATGGTPQSTLINTQFPAPLTANLAENRSRVPLSGQTVNFAAPITGPSATLTASAPVTDSNGNVSTLATANGNAGSYNVGASFGNSTAQFALTNVLFSGQPGKVNCHGQSVATLSKRYGTLRAAASALGYPSVQALQAAIKQFCGG